VAVLLLVLYFSSSSVKSAFESIGELKDQGGYLFSAISTSLFAALLPFMVIMWRKTGRYDSNPVGYLIFLLIFWALKGMEVDFLYRMQVKMFGDGTDAATIAKKVVFDQFVYGPLWAVWSVAIPYRWADEGFSIPKLLKVLNWDFFLEEGPVLQVSAWVVWIPIVSVVYCLPAALQIPMFNLAILFWTLTLALLLPPRQAQANAHESIPSTAPTVELETKQLHTQSTDSAD